MARSRAPVGGASHAGSVEVHHPHVPAAIPLDPSRPGRTAGLEIPLIAMLRGAGIPNTHRLGADDVDDLNAAEIGGTRATGADQ